MTEIYQAKFESVLSNLETTIGSRKKELLDMIHDAALTDPQYKPTLIHPEHLLGIILTSNEFPPDIFSGPNAPLQRRIFMQNFETIATMLPDIIESNYNLRSAGFSYTENPLLYSDPKNRQHLINVANQYADVIQQTYPDGNEGTRYPLKQKNPKAIVDDVETGKFFMYAVQNSRGDTVAVFGNVIRDDILGQRGYAVELGRTGTKADKTPELVNVPLRGVSKLRLYHLLTDPRFIADPEKIGKSATMIYSDIRLAKTWNPEFPGGRGVQSVFFGGQQFGEFLGFGFSSVGWRYNLERTEPFLFIFKPTFPESYKQSLSEKTLFIPDPHDAERVSKFLSGTFGTLPRITHNGSVEDISAIPPEEIEVVLNFTPTKHGRTSDIFTKIDIVDTDFEFKERNTGKIQTLSLLEALQISVQGEAPSVEVYVDATLGGGVEPKRITGIIKTLKDFGFVCNGWVPSSRGNGDAILISYAKLGTGANDPVDPDMPEKYYQGELAETREEALQIFQDLAEAGPLHINN